MPCRLSISLTLLFVAGATFPCRAMEFEEGTLRQPGAILIRPGSKIAFLGDSITDQAWKHPAGFIKLVVQALEANKIPVTPIPAGVGGNIAREMRSRLQKDVLEKQPDWLVLSCGINDVWHLRSHKQDFDQFQKNITAIVDSALKANIRIIVMTTTVIGEDLGVDHNLTLQKYNHFLRALAKDKGCLVADLDADFRAALQAKKGPLTADGVHLNPHGEMIVANRILQTLGLTQKQIEPQRGPWSDIADAWHLRANYDKGMGKNLLVETRITIRQYERLEKIARTQKRTVLDFVNEMHRQNIQSHLRPQGEIESYDAIFAQKLQGELQKKLQARFVMQVNNLVR